MVHDFIDLTRYTRLGENHVAFSMVCETLARYGCASTAMCYVMHIGAVATLMLRPTPELVDKYIRPLNGGKIKVFGTVAGAAFIQLLTATLVQHNVANSYAQIVQAVIIVGAVYLARGRSLR